METREEKIERVMGQRHGGIIVLEDIHDPHNAAAVWRSCDAFGFGRVNLIFEQEKKFNPKQVGKASSSSANKWLDFEIFESTEECLETIKDKGYTIYATMVDETAESLMKATFEESKVAICFGNEHRGLSETAIKMADRKIYIPMQGMVQSLNLSVTAGVVMWEYLKRKKTVISEE